MTGVRRAPALLTLACFLRLSFCAVELNCTVSPCAEGFCYTVQHVNATGCDETCSTVDDTGKETVVATHTGNWNGVAKLPSCHPKMKFKADCDSLQKSQGFEHYSSVCEIICSETGGSTRAYYANFAAPVLILLPLLAAAVVLIPKIRNCIKRVGNSEKVTKIEMSEVYKDCPHEL